ncbi:MAG: hypothetical protein LBG80_19075 [Bacteroidales bacterium]|jgi:hypothetical protein|nr:hypothetical protein [Bacteroidales bacterium]
MEILRYKDMQLDILTRLDKLVSDLGNGSFPPDFYVPIRYENFNLDIIYRLESLIYLLTNIYARREVYDGYYYIDTYSRMIYIDYRGGTDFIIDINEDVLINMREIMHIAIYNNSGNDLTVSFPATIQYSDGNDYLEIGSDRVGELSLLPFPIDKSGGFQYLVRGIHE